MSILVKKEEQKEEIILAQIIKKDGVLTMNHSKSASQCEVYGFLKIYLKVMEDAMGADFEGTDDWVLY